MPNALSLAAYIAKNSLESDGVWLVLAEITLPDATVLRVCRNTENVTWPTAGGHEYAAFPFDLEEINDQNKSEVPRVALRVSNVTRALQGYLDASGGGVGSSVIIRVVHSKNLAETDPEFEAKFRCIDCTADNMWVTFFIGAASPWTVRFPRNRLLKDFCRWRFKSAECAYSGGETTCDKTLTQCRLRSNSARFGGFPGVGQGGIYA
ncbi:MAG: DUF1833 family protein [Acidobacteriales bacterium]|nr:DUF1833 family protein [Terriglobales bacterium]